MTPYYDEDGITIYHGDCRDVLPLLAFDVIVTDPPYGIGWRRGANKARASKAHTGIINDHDTGARDAVIAAYPTLPAIVFGSFYAPYPANCRQVLVWHKPADAGVVGSTTGYRRDAEPVFLVGPWPQLPVSASSVLRSCVPNIGGASSQAGLTGHPHAKPVDLMRQLIGRCPPGVIVDPFMGSGSTLRAARDLGRTAIGIEISEEYCDTGARWLAQGILAL